MEIFTFRDNTKKQEFKQLFETYYAPFCLYAKRYIKEDELREDLVSDVFATLWSKRDDIELQAETTIAYIKVCVRNGCLNYLKHLNYETNYVEQCLNNEPQYATSPDCIYTLKELYHILNESLNALPENYRTVFIKSFYEGKKLSEIASEMNISIKSVDRYKAKVMQELTKELKDYLPLLLFLQQWNNLQ